MHVQCGAPTHGGRVTGEERDQGEEKTEEERKEEERKEEERKEEERKEEHREGGGERRRSEPCDRTMRRVDDGVDRSLSCRAITSPLRALALAGHTERSRGSCFT